MERKTGRSRCDSLVLLVQSEFRLCEILLGLVGGNVKQF